MTKGQFMHEVQFTTEGQFTHEVQFTTEGQFTHEVQFTPQGNSRGVSRDQSKKHAVGVPFLPFFKEVPRKIKTEIDDRKRRREQREDQIIRLARSQLHG